MKHGNPLGKGTLLIFHQKTQIVFLLRLSKRSNSKEKQKLEETEKRGEKAGMAGEKGSGLEGKEHGGGRPVINSRPGGRRQFRLCPRNQDYGRSNIPDWKHYLGVAEKKPPEKCRQKQGGRGEEARLKRGAFPCV